MATERNRSWFFQGVSTTAWPRFRTNNKPTQATFEDLLQSILVKLESSDTATETKAGHVRFATKAEVVNKTDTDIDGHNMVVKPSDMPDIGHHAEETSVLVDDATENGLQITKYAQPSLNALKYLLGVAYDTDYLAIDVANGKLTFSEDLIQLLSDLEGLVPIPGDGPFINPEEDFSTDAFGTGAIKIVGGAFTVDTDDSTMEIDAITHKVQLKDGGVTLAKMATLTPGDVIVGQTASGNPIAVNISKLNHILIGNGTGVSSVDLNTLLSAITIANNSITAVKMHTSAFGDGLNRDADEMFVDLAPGASLEFNSGKLQLKNDDYSPDAQHYYGTGSIAGSNDKGYFSLANRSILKKLEYSLGAGETIIYIVSDDDLINTEPAGTEITTMHIDVLKNTTGNYYSPDASAVIEYDMTDGIVNSISINNLTESTNYIINIMYIKTN